MEDQTDFVLDHALADWRQHLSQSPSYRVEDLAELESHLRDSVSALAGRGLTEEEAFLIASRRVGGSQILEPEFAKVNGQEIWLNRLLWMLIGIQAFGVISALAGTFSRTGSSLLMVSLLRPGSESAETVTAFFGSPVSIVGSALFFFIDLVTLAAVTAACWWLMRRSKDWVGRWIRRRGGLVIGAVVFCVAMMLFSFLGQLSYPWLVRSAGQATFSKVAVSFSMANLVLLPLKMIALAALTVWLARRQMRRSTA